MVERGTCTGSTQLSTRYYNSTYMFFAGELNDMGIKDISVWECYPDLDGPDGMKYSTNLRWVNICYSSAKHHLSNGGWNLYLSCESILYDNHTANLWLSDCGTFHWIWASCDPCYMVIIPQVASCLTAGGFTLPEPWHWSMRVISGCSRFKSPLTQHWYPIFTGKDP